MVSRSSKAHRNNGSASCMLPPASRTLANRRLNVGVSSLSTGNNPSFAPKAVCKSCDNSFEVSWPKAGSIAAQVPPHDGPPSAMARRNKSSASGCFSSEWHVVHAASPCQQPEPDSIRTNAQTDAKVSGCRLPRSFARPRITCRHNSSASFRRPRDVSTSTKSCCAPYRFFSSSVPSISTDAALSTDDTPDSCVSTGSCWARRCSTRSALAWIKARNNISAFFLSPRPTATSAKHLEILKVSLCCGPSISMHASRTRTRMGSACSYLPVANKVVAIACHAAMVSGWRSPRAFPLPVNTRGNKVLAS
mmetsp:Transcript_80366/g.233334  ORF Transcript_80366/g.233334 Transcript_80366/m.233334 type:complete len:306 (-) Transcript_80366:2452-3369(-)